MAFQQPQLVSVHWRVLEDMRQIARNALVGVAGHVVLKARLEIIGQHVLFRLEMAVKRLPGHFGLLANLCDGQVLVGVPLHELIEGSDQGTLRAQGLGVFPGRVKCDKFGQSVQPPDSVLCFTRSVQYTIPREL